jgi:ADP-heptose:LPS heptosyltransferase
MRILFVTSTRIGDAVMGSGVLRELVDRHPEARFTVACGPLAAPLFAAVPRLDRVIAVTKRPLDLHWLGLWRAVRPVAWDLVVDLRRSLLAYALTARRRAIVAAAAPGRTQVAIFSSALDPQRTFPPFVFTAPEHRTAAARLVPDGAPVLALGPVASLPEKTWPRDRFRALVGLLLNGPCAGWRVAAYGGPGDGDAAAAVLQDVPEARRIVLVGEPDLLTVHACLARSGAFVGNDSGLAHLAAAAGVPTVAVFGDTDPARYAPWGGVAVQDDSRILDRVAPEAVARAVARLLHARAAPAGLPAEPPAEPVERG